MDIDVDQKQKRTYILNQVNEPGEVTNLWKMGLNFKEKRTTKFDLDEE